MSPVNTMATPNVRGTKAVTISTVFVALAGFSVLARCVTRFGFVRTCGADDILVILALALSIAFTVLIQIQEHEGLGRHLSSLRTEEQVKLLKSFWVSVMCYYLSLTFIKSSILCQFLRFLRQPIIRRVCWCLLVIVVLNGFSTVFGSAFACTPVAYFWDKTIHGGHCVNLLAFWFSNATFNIVSDIAICVLPMPALKSLQLPRKQKYGLIFVFAMGGFGCVTSIIRLQSLYAVAHSTDVTWNNVGAATWSSIELNIGIICACLPTLRPVFNRLFPHLPHHNKPHAAVQPRPERYMQHWPGRESDRGVELLSDAGRAAQDSPVPRVYWKDEQKTYSRSTQEECWPIRETLREREQHDDSS